MAGLAAVRTTVRIPVMAGSHCEHEPLALILQLKEASLTAEKQKTYNQ